MKTVLLNPDTWDLLVDANKNLAVANEPYRLAQDVATAERTLKLDNWYYPDYGIPAHDQIFAKKPPLSLVRSLLEKQALTVSGVVKAKCVITNFADRTLTAAVIITDNNGTDLNVVIAQ